MINELIDKINNMEIKNGGGIKVITRDNDVLYYKIVYAYNNLNDITIIHKDKNTCIMQEHITIDELKKLLIDCTNKHWVEYIEILDNLSLDNKLDIEKLKENMSEEKLLKLCEYAGKVKNEMENNNFTYKEGLIIADYLTTLLELEI